MKDYSPEETEQLDNSTDPLIERVWTQLKELLSDPSQDFRQEIIGMTNLIVVDFKSIREHKNAQGCVIITNEGEDKLLERYLKVVDKADAIVSAMRGVAGGEKEVSGKKTTAKKEIPVI